MNIIQNLQQLALEIITTAKEKGYTLSIAESCTGGLISHLLTNIDGSSSVVKVGVVSYSKQSKIELLNIPEEIFSSNRVVSEQVVKSMAIGVKNILNTDFAVATTGVAGEVCDEEGTSPGTVWISCASKNSITAKQFAFTGDRKTIKNLTAYQLFTVLLQQINTGI